nr:RNA-directed DNA polymerase, eukaryota [Tanacetum cinerariifolium]
MKDRWFFDLNGDDRFCVKDVSCLLDDVFLPKAEVPTRWIKSIPIKINIFAWKLCLDRLPTRVNLAKRNVAVASLLCPLCDSEDAAHLFFRCDMAKDVMFLVSRWWDLKDRRCCPVKVVKCSVARSLSGDYRSLFASLASSDVELKDNIIVAMPKITREGYYTCNVRVEYEWKPPRCSSCKEYQKEYRPITKKPNASSSGIKKKCVEPTIEVSNSNLFDVLHSVDNDGEFGTNEKANNLVNNDATSSGSSFMNIDNDVENPLVPTGIVKSDSEVKLVFDETANLRIPTSGKDTPPEADKNSCTRLLMDLLAH